MPVGRLCLYPCGGIEEVASCVVRQATYIIDEELLAGKTMILCVPALLRGVDEDVLMVENNPTILIEGCQQYCGSNLMRVVNITPAAMVYLPDIAEATGLSAGLIRQKLNDSGQRLARGTAEVMARLGQSLLDDPGYNYSRQTVQRQSSILFDHTDEPAAHFAYVKVETGIYRPAAMPPLPGE